MRVAIIEKNSGDLKPHIRELIYEKGCTVLFLLSSMPIERITGEIRNFNPAEIHSNDSSFEKLLKEQFSIPVRTV